MTFMPFQTRPGYTYVYDMNTNGILKISKEQYDALCSYIKGNASGSAVLDEFREKGLLLEPQIERIEHPASQLLDYQMKRCVSSVTFQMSQNCNLRCVYCPFSGNDIYTNRLRSSKDIDWQTVKNGIDFLIANSADADKLNITFYGGEPLLAKKLVINAIEYATKSISGKKITFGMTTNGTLLDNEFLEKVADVDLAIMVSMDGPKEIQDENRFYGDGSGSFDDLYQNIVNLRNNFPSLYEKLTFNTVINVGSDYKKIFNFFRESPDLFARSKVRFSELSQNYTDIPIQYDEVYRAERNYDTLKAYLSLLGYLDRDLISNFREEVEGVFSYPLMFGSKKVTPSVTHPAGTCIPGLKKLFIDVDGIFYPCERVDETSTLMQIGNLDTGFDIEKVLKVLNVGAATEESCKKCWAFHCCTICPVSADNGKNDHYLQKYKLSKCSGVKDSALGMLKNYTMLKELKFQFDEELVKLNTEGVVI